jgi:hypothetical protein
VTYLRAGLGGTLSSESDKAPIMILLAFACLGGAAVLAWFSSPVRMTLTRSNDGTAVVSFEARLFGLFLRTSDRIDHVKSVSRTTFQGPGKFSDTPDRFVFDTPSGPVDRGMIQQLFVGELSEIRTFFEGENEGAASGEGDGQAPVERVERDARPRTLSFSSIAPASELRRFVFAQLAVAFLAFVGLGVGWMGAKALVS